MGHPDQGLLHLLSWPKSNSFSSTFWNLESLDLNHTWFPPKLFQDVQLHRTLPNLKHIYIKSAGKHSREIFTLPDMSGFERLQSIGLQGKFHFPKDLDGDGGVPFPRCLSELSLLNANFYDSAVKEAVTPWSFNFNGFRRDEYQISKGKVAEKIGECLPECCITFWLEEGPPRTMKRGVVQVRERNH